MAQGERKLSVRYTFDFASIQNDADRIKKILAGTYDGLKEGQSAITSLKGKITEMANALKGNSAKASFEEMSNAARQTQAQLEGLLRTNQQINNSLHDRMAEVSQAKMQPLSGADAEALNKEYNALAKEIRARAELSGQIGQQLKAVKQLNAEIQAKQDSTAKTQAEASATKTLTQQLSEAKKRMQELAAEGKTASKEYEDLKNKSQSLSAAMKQVSSDSQVQQQVRFRTALMNVKQQMMELEQAGKRDTEQYRLLRAEAERLQRTMYETNTQMRILATPNTKMSATINMMTGLSGAVSAATGTIALFGGENEKVMKIQQKLNGIMAITMGLQSINQTLNKNSAFQVGIIGQLEEWWAACKAKAAAATTADTTAKAANTAATKAGAAATAAETAATNTATAATTAHAFSWKALGIAIKSVPIWGWAIAGLTVLVSVIIAVTTHLNKLTNSQKAMKEAMAKAYTEIQKERSELDLLYRTATNANKPLNDRLIAIQKLQSQYPEYFQNLKQEAILAGDAADAYERLKIAIEQKAIAKGMESMKETAYQNIGKWLDSHFDEKSWLDNNQTKAQTLKSKYTQEQIAKYYPILTALENGTPLTKFPEGITEEGLNELGFVKKWEDSKKEYEEAYKKANKESIEKIAAADKYIEEITDNLPKTIEEQRNAWSGDEKEGYKADPNYYKRMMEKALQDADDYVPRDLGQGMKETPGDIKRRQEQARKDYYKYKNLYDNARFDPKDRSSQMGASDIAGQKVSDLAAQQNLERMNLQLQMEREFEQKRIDIMGDGAEKRRRQQQLDNDTEMANLQERMNQEIQAEVNRQQSLWNAREDAKAKEASAAGKQYQKKAFDSGSLKAHQWGLGYDIDREDNRTGNVEMDEIDLITQRYSHLQTLLLKLQAKRIEDQAKADRQSMDDYLMEYGTMEEKVAAINRAYSKKKSEATNDGDRMKIQQEWQSALEGATFDDWMENRASLAFGEMETLSRETIDQLIEEMEQYRSKILDTLDPEKIEKFNTALSNLRKARISDTNSPLSALTPEYIRERKAAQEELNDAERTSTQLTQKQADAQEKVSQTVGRIMTKLNAATNGKVTLGADEITDGATLQQTIDGMSQMEDVAQEDIEALEELNAQLGDAQVNLQNSTDAANKAKTTFERLAEAFKAKFEGWQDPLNKALGAFEKINETLAGVNEAFSSIKGTAEALGADTGVGSDWDNAEKMLQGVTGITGGISDAIKSALTGNVGGVLSGIASAFTSPINAVVAIHDNKREKAIQRIQDEVEELQRINKRLDRALDGQYSKEAASTYAEQIENAEQQIALINQQIREEQDKKNSDSDRIQEWRDQIEELQNDIEDYKAAALDAILGEDVATSIDNFADAMADAWGSTREQAKSAKDYVKTMLKQMVLEAMKTDLTAPIEKLREMMSTAMDDSLVTDAEVAGLQDFAQGIAEMISQQYAWADDILKDETSSQSGTSKGGYATASQDSVEELSGRMAAVHTSVEGIRIAQATMAIDVTAIRAAMDATQANATETRGLTLIAVGHLETIAKNTSKLHDMSEKLEKIEQHTRNL
ncbi:MAG: hypothetical protein LIP09_00890 [Bacteroidales bacterium]|nr:hypothetical protein [Bacteroidales bacterium]